MITIGFSTREIDEEFISHIRKTVGVKNVEIIPFENKGTHSLTEVYDEITTKAKNDIIVLLHDDINIKTKNWGRRLLNHFNTTDYGIIGVAGTYDFHESGMWWKHQHAMVGQVDHKHPQNNKQYTSKYSAKVGENIIPVVALDGVFFAFDKNKINYSFDTNIQGFHFYDVDFTFGNYIQGVKVGVITNIHLLHESVGETNSSWENNRIKFVEKWVDKLPSKHPEAKIFYTKDKNKLKFEPKVSIIILNKSNNPMLFKCIDSFLNNSDYKNYEILIGDTGSKKSELIEIGDRYTQNNIKLIDIGSYHFAKNNNDIVKNYVSDDTELLLFCNNDIELISDTLTNMVGYYIKNKRKVGTMGARLYYEDNTLQHAGVMFYTKNNQLYITHQGIHTRYRYPDNDYQPVIANTAALLMINKKLFQNIYFDEDYVECFEDVQLNLDVLNSNYTNVLINNAVAYHYESQTRTLNGDKNKREQADYKKLMNKLVLNKKLTKYIITI